jgi:hypothetical protein
VAEKVSLAKNDHGARPHWTDEENTGKNPCADSRKQEVKVDELIVKPAAYQPDFTSLKLVQGGFRKN